MCVGGGGGGGACVGVGVCVHVCMCECVCVGGERVYGLRNSSSACLVVKLICFYYVSPFLIVINNIS